jgi:hypothetical protein
MLLRTRGSSSSEDATTTLKEFFGYYVLRLVKCDGVSVYSNGGLYDGVDETSFRGELLKNCASVIDKGLLDAAWEHKFPEAATAYGRALLAAAEAAGTAPRGAHPSILSRLGFVKSAETPPLSEQLDIVRAAGRWFVFWGDLGHAIRAYF